MGLEYRKKRRQTKKNRNYRQKQKKNTKNAKYYTYLSFCDTLEKKKKLCGILCLVENKHKEDRMMSKRELFCSKLKETMLSVTAAMALMVTMFSVHTCCWFILGQDTLPENAKKLRKF